MLAMVSQIAARITRYGTRLRRGEGVVSLVIDGPQRTRGGTTPYPRSLPAVGRTPPYPFRPSTRRRVRPPPLVRPLSGLCPGRLADRAAGPVAQRQHLDPHPPAATAAEPGRIELAAPVVVARQGAAAGGATRFGAPCASKVRRRSRVRARLAPNLVVGLLSHAAPRACRGRPACAGRPREAGPGSSGSCRR